MRSVHLLDLTTFYPPRLGGVEAYAAALHSEWLERVPGSQVTVLTSDRVGRAPALEESHDGRLVVVRYPAVEPVDNFASPREWLPRRARAVVGHADLVLSHTRFYAASWQAHAVANAVGAAHVHIEHGATPVQSGGAPVRLVADLVDRTVGRHTLRKADRVIAVSAAAGDFVRDLSGVEATVLRRGIRLPETAWTCRPRRERPLVTYVGRLVDGKGVADLVDAVAGLELELELVGDGPERAALERQAVARGVTATFRGSVPPAAVVDVLRRTDVFCNPSHSEGLPTVVLEAAALGVPVVATDVGGTRDIVADGRTGWLVPARDKASLREALTQVTSSPDLAAARGDALRAATATSFDWGHVVDFLRDAAVEGPPKA